MRLPSTPRLPDARWRWVPGLIGIGLLNACSGKDADTSSNVTLPGETSAAEDTPQDTGDFLLDTAGGGLTDDDPEHTLTITQEGIWDLSPRGGPWTTLTGSLDVLELLDGDDLVPACEATYALTGEASEDTTCDTCDASFNVSFYLSDGDPSACSDPDLPLADEVRTLGWSAVDGTIYYNYYDSGVWLPWYQGEEDEDTVTFSWSDTLAVLVEEDSG